MEEWMGGEEVGMSCDVKVGFGFCFVLCVCVFCYFAKLLFVSK